MVDLTEALRASVAAAKTKKTPGRKRGGRGKAKEKTGQAEPARKTRSRKPTAKARSGKAARRPTLKQAA